jgi:hypothetical protein
MGRVQGLARPYRGAVTATLMASLLVLVFASRAHAYVYWSGDPGDLIEHVGRASLDGTQSDPNFVLGFLPQQGGVAVDSQHVYWADADAIGRADIGGSNSSPSFITLTGQPVGVAVDSQHIYWTEGSKIGRANLDGSGVNESFIDTHSGATGIAVDNQYIYTTDQPAKAVDQFTLAGASLGELAGAGSRTPSGIAVDSQHLFFSNTDGTIERADLDGSGVIQALLTVPPDAGFLGLAVEGGHLYWANRGNFTIGRADLDGGDVRPNLVSTASIPAGVAVDSGAPGRATPSTASMAFGVQPLLTLSAAQSLGITNTGTGNLNIGSVHISGADPDDFIISSDSCSGVTLAVADSCAVHIRFAPSATGVRSANLTVPSDDDSGPTQVSLTGTGGELPQGPAGTAGAAGAPGATGAQGQPGAQGPPGKDGEIELVSCRTVTVKRHGHRVKRKQCVTKLVTGVVKFTAARTARASLTRRGRVYATGTATAARVRLRAHRRIDAGHYTLRLRYRHGRHTVTQKATVSLR